MCKPCFSNLASVFSKGLFCIGGVRPEASLKFLRAVLTPFVSEEHLTSPHTLSRSFGVLCDIAAILHSLNKSEIGYQLCARLAQGGASGALLSHDSGRYFSGKCCRGWDILILTVSLLTCFEEHNVYWDLGEANRACVKMKWGRSNAWVQLLCKPGQLSNVKEKLTCFDAFFF